MSLKRHKKAASARLPDGFVFFGIESGDIEISDGLLLIWMSNIVCF